METTTTPEGRMNVKAWYVEDDGTLTPVTVVGVLPMFGGVRVKLADGSTKGVARANLVSHQTGERLTLKELV